MPGSEKCLHPRKWLTTKTHLAAPTVKTASDQNSLDAMETNIIDNFHVGFVYTRPGKTHVFDSPWPSQAILCNTHWSTLISVMACCILGAEQLLEPMLTCPSDRMKHISIEFHLKLKDSIKESLKTSSGMRHPFFSASKCGDAQEIKRKRRTTNHF